MFLLEIDPARKSLRWVRAGHEPAILYDPLQNDIQMLTGDGIALGVDHKFRFQVSSILMTTKVMSSSCLTDWRNALTASNTASVIFCAG